MNTTDTSSRGFALTLPKDWLPTDPPDSLALLARPACWPQAPAPAISVADTDSSAAEAGSEVYLAAQFAGLANAFDDVVLIVADWLEPDCLDLLFAHSTMGSDVTTRQRHLLLSGGRSLVASASSADHDWPDLCPVLTGAVTSVRATS